MAWHIRQQGVNEGKMSLQVLMTVPRLNMIPAAAAAAAADCLFLEYSLLILQLAWLRAPGTLAHGE